MECEKTAVLFGFDSEDRESTGYLKVDGSGCSVVPDRESATEFALSADREGWRPPEDWCRFFREEPSVANWRFHPVVLLSGRA